VDRDYGTLFIKLDDKYRIILPMRSRANFERGAHLAEGPNECLFLFTDPQFDAFRQQLDIQAPSGMVPIAFDRMFYSSLFSQIPDKQGRIRIPLDLRQSAGLTREIALIGLPSRMEIWDAERWAAFRAEHRPRYMQLTEGIR
jgi:MraZ protein